MPTKAARPLTWEHCTAVFCRMRDCRWHWTWNIVTQKRTTNNCGRVKKQESCFWFVLIPSVKHEESRRWQRDRRNDPPTDETTNQQTKRPNNRRNDQPTDETTHHQTKRPANPGIDSRAHEFGSMERWSGPQNNITLCFKPLGLLFAVWSYTSWHRMNYFSRFLFIFKTVFVFVEAPLSESDYVLPSTMYYPLPSTRLSRTALDPPSRVKITASVHCDVRQAVTRC